MCKTLNVEDNVTFHQMLKEIPCSRFPTIEIEEEPDGRDFLTRLTPFTPRLSSTKWKVIFVISQRKGVPYGYDRMGNGKRS